MAVFFALLTAACYGTSAVLQQHAAASSDADGMLALALALLRSPRWWVGKVADIGAFIFLALALAHGSLVLVQSIMAGSLLFALALSAAANRRWITGRDALAALVLGGSIALLLVVGRPGHGHHRPSLGAWALTIGLVAGAAIAAKIGSSRAGPAVRAALVGSAGGALFALDAALLEVAARHAAHHSLVDGLRTWQLYGFAIAASTGFLFVQQAYQAGPLTASLPAITATEPVVAVMIGLIVFGEKLTTVWPAPIVEVIAAIGILVGVIALTRSPAVSGQPTEKVLVA